MPAASSRYSGWVAATLSGEMRDLPMLSEPTCPAALRIAGACASQQGVVCRVMELDVAGEAGTGMSAGALGFMQHEAEGGIYLNLKSDPSTVTMFCHGDAAPVLHDDDDGDELLRATYTACPVWQAAVKARLEGRDELAPAQEPEPVAMGVASHEEPDPWAQARALEELTA